MEKLPHYIECHNWDGINRNKNINAYLFTILNLTVSLPEQRVSFRDTEQNVSSKRKTLIQWERSTGAQSYFCLVNSRSADVHQVSRHLNSDSCSLLCK